MRAAPSLLAEGITTGLTSSSVYVASQFGFPQFDLQAGLVEGALPFSLPALVGIFVAQLVVGAVLAVGLRRLMRIEAPPQEANPYRELAENGRLAPEYLWLDARPLSSRG